MNEERIPPKSSVPPAAAPRNLNGVVGLCLSVIGLVGWLVTLGLIFSMRHEQLTGDGQRDLVIGLGNFMTYLHQVVTGVLGLIAFGFFSATGVLVSALGLTQEPRRIAAVGLALGLLGAALGLSVVLWRLQAWGLLF